MKRLTIIYHRFINNKMRLVLPQPRTDNFPNICVSSMNSLSTEIKSSKTSNELKSASGDLTGWLPINFRDAVLALKCMTSSTPHICHHSLRKKGRVTRTSELLQIALFKKKNLFLMLFLMIPSN